MKFLITITALALSVSAGILYSQTTSTPFEASFFFGTGPCTTFDFNGTNNGVKLSCQAGVNVTKQIGKSRFLQVGIGYASRGSFTDEVITYGGGGTIVNAYEVRIKSIDFPLMYYTRISSKSMKNNFLFFGVRNTWLPVAPWIYGSNQTAIPEKQCYREYNLAFCSGFGLEISKTFRLDLAVNCHLLSLVKEDYREIFEQAANSFGSRIYPAELIVSINYLLFGKERE